MTQYFFNLHNDVEAVDEEGMDFPNDSAALHYAAQSIRSLVAHSIDATGQFALHHSIDVLKENAVLLANIKYGDVITVLP